jgi:hypothetical protein
VHLVEEPPPIPLALDSFHEGGTGYDSREDALAACYAWYEAAELLKSWQELAAGTELYPERNTWYLDEIAHLLGDNTPCFHYGLCVQVVVHARGKNGLECLAAMGTTPDEAIEALYQCVYEWSRMLQDEVYSHAQAHHNQHRGEAY